ncbi:arsenate reductase family protein [Allobacillus sp. GCM10007491]|uniref:Arsenate reductase family protein n=2 Tax=Allobacillus TaxID=1400133 RepID=A0A941CY22_9BACI|nr:MULTISPECIES: arsenate reductase family protein [Allobacillus]MBR7554705.1 arsenate reductase family protein [Allobacillus saliphilus]TSJ66713.1 arsenate reductase family protein [Allobacillus salarius]
MTVTIYQYPKCGTCRKALKWLDENGVTYESVHIVDNPPSESELKQMIEQSDLPLKKFFNTSGKKYRELGLKDKLEEMSDDEKIKLLASDGMLMKRPLVTDGKKATVGFKEEIFESEWK